MLAYGYAETGRFADAEEIANRAITKTKGKDLYALEALLNVLQIQGRSSEIKGIIEQYIEHFEGTALLHLKCHDGAGLIQRGNYTGAVEVLRSLEYELGPAERRVPSAVTLASTFLWQLLLSSSNENIPNYCLSLANISGTLIGTHSTAVDDVYRSLLLSLAELKYADDQERGDSDSPNDHAMTLIPRKSGWEKWIPEFNATSRRRLKATPIDFIPPPELKSRHYNHMTNRWNYNSLESSHSSTVNNTNAPSSYVFSFPFEVVCPSFLRVKPTFNQIPPLPIASMNNFPSQHQSSDVPSDDKLHSSTQLSDREMATYALSIPVSEALGKMVRGDYMNSSIELRNVQRSFWRLGGSIVQRDVLEQTLVEA